MSRPLTLVEVKARFSRCVREAEQGEPVVLTRHGRPVAALVPIDLYEEILRLRDAGPAGGLAGLAGGWEGSEEVAEEAVRYGRSPGRRLPGLD